MGVGGGSEGVLIQKGLRRGFEAGRRRVGAERDEAETSDATKERKKGLKAEKDRKSPRRVRRDEGVARWGLRIGGVGVGGGSTKTILSN